MRDFCQLFYELDQTTQTNRKINALKNYFRNRNPADAAWALYYLAGKKRKRLVTSSKLRSLVNKQSSYPDWLLEDCYASVGDSAEYVTLLSETINLTSSDQSLVLPGLAKYSEELHQVLANQDDDDRLDEMIKSYWSNLSSKERFVFNKMLTGAFRVGVSEKTIINAISQLHAIDPAVLSHRLMGHWRPSGSFFQSLIAQESPDDLRNRPYPFMLAHPLSGEVSDLEDTAAWIAEWKWDGIRGQLIKRDEHVCLWSRGEEIISQSFPDLCEAAEGLPDGTVLDGEVLAGTPDRLMSFSALQKRLGRKKPSAKLMQKVPCCFLAFDLLEFENKDVRTKEWAKRRELLESIDMPNHFRANPTEAFYSWDQLKEMRKNAESKGSEGLMLKKKDSPYGVGRVRGHWWKWKIDPKHIDAVLLYAQAGHGIRANQYTDYTLGVWQGDQLVTIGKAYSGLNRSEIAELDRWIKQNTLERYGPVRKVPAVQVIEIAFEGINVSTRHKAGLALRFPRITRWRQDKIAKEADHLGALEAMLKEPDVTI